MELRITFPGGKRVDVEADRAVIRTDQAVESGGEGSAPEPFTLFLAAIGSCAGVYVQGFLKSHGLPTDGLAITERARFDEATGRLVGVDLEIQAPRGIPAKYLKALERSADLCAVKKAILNPPDFAIRALPPPE